VLTDVHSKVLSGEQDKIYLSRIRVNEYLILISNEQDGKWVICLKTVLVAGLECLHRVCIPHRLLYPVYNRFASRGKVITLFHPVLD